MRAYEPDGSNYHDHLCCCPGCSGDYSPEDFEVLEQSEMALSKEREMDEKQKACDLLASIQQQQRDHIAACEQIRLMCERAAQCVKNESLTPEDAKVVARFAMQLTADLQAGEPAANVADMAAGETARLVVAYDRKANERYETQ